MNLRLPRRTILLAGSAGLVGQARAFGPPGWGEVFANWADSNGVHQGGIAATRNGRLVHASGFAQGGAAEPAGAARAQLWSLAKFLTAVAVARLVGQGKVALDTPIGQAMAPRFARHGVDPSGALGRLTVAQLLTQHSGLPTDFPNDSFLPGLRARLLAAPARATSQAELEPALFRAVPLAPPGQGFAYSDANYVLLGRLIEHLTGTSYVAHMNTAVLAPAGVLPATLDPQWGFIEAAGGWRLSPAEYLAVARHALLAPEGLPPALRAWADDVAGKDTGSEASLHYGLGLFTRSTRAGPVRFHPGAMGWRRRSAAGQGNFSAGSHFLMAPDGTAWCAHFQPGVTDTARADLERALWQPMRGTQDQGLPDLFPAILPAAR